MIFLSAPLTLVVSEDFSPTKRLRELACSLSDSCSKSMPCEAMLAPVMMSAEGSLSLIREK